MKSTHTSLPVRTVSYDLPLPSPRNLTMTRKNTHTAGPGSENRSTRTRTVVSLAALSIAAAWAAPALAQSNIDPVNKFSWSENCGWMNWRDAGSVPGSQGALVGGTFLSGFVWGENFGWINLGDGTPTNGVSYANPTVGPVVGIPDFGVNLDSGTGNLSGFAWGENVGWINFSGGAMATPPQPARLDGASQRFRGYAWAENIGWINLDLGETGKFVGVRTCAADFNGDGTLDPDDLADYIGAFFAVPAPLTADFNGDGTVDPDDLADYIGAFFGGCF